MEIHTIEDLITIIQQHPEWRDRLREALFTDQERQVPDRLRRVEEVLERLVDSHERAIIRLERLEASHQQALERFERLEVSHQQALERFERLEVSHQQALERFERLEVSHQQALERFERLEVSHQQALERLERLEVSHQQALERLERLEASHQQALERLERLEASHQQALERLERLEASHQQALERLERLEATLQQLVQEVRELRLAVERLTRWLERLDDEVAKSRGYILEVRFHQRASAILGRYVRRARVMDLGMVVDDLADSGTEIEESEKNEILALDELVSAKHPRTGEPIHIAVEVSWMIFPEDVERASRRAALLTKYGVQTFPAVAGEGITPEARELAERKQVLVILDGAASVDAVSWIF